MRRELDLKMTFLRRLAVLLLFLILAIPQGWAQIGSPIAVNTGSGTLNVYGFQFSVTACTYSGNSGLVTGCSNDNVDLQGVQSGRDTISLMLLNKSLSQSSAALSQTHNGNTTSLSFTVKVVPSGSYAGTQASAAILKGVGTYTQGGGTSTTFTTNAGDVGGSPFGTAPGITWASTAGQQNLASSQQSLTAFSNSFSFTENITLKSNTNSGSVLQLNTLTMKFYTTPEPASISALLVGLTGLVMVRRRRRAF
jgi:hypothetical protein